MIKIVVDSTGYIEEDMLKQNDIKSCSIEN